MHARGGDGNAIGAGGGGGSQRDRIKDIACVGAEELLDVIIHGAQDASAIEIDEVRSPLGVVLATEQGSIGGEADDIAIAFERGEVGGLSERGAEVAGAFFVLRGVFAEIDLGTVTVVIIVARKVIEEPLGLLVVVFIDDIDAQFVGDLPPGVIIFAVRKGADGADDGDLGMLRFDRSVDHLETFFEHGGYMFLIADAKVLEMKGSGVAGGGTFRAPGGIGRAVGPFDQVEHILDVSRHGFERQTALAGAALMIRILAANAGGHDGKRLGADVFAELEEFVVAKTKRLVIAPEIELAAALFNGADAVFPTVEVIESVAVRETTAGKAHELGMDLGNRLGEVSPQAIGTVVKRVVRKEGNLIQGHAAASHGEDCDSGGGIGVGGGDAGGEVLPIATGDIEVPFAERCVVFGFQTDDEVGRAVEDALAAPATAGEQLPSEYGKIIGIAGLHGNAVEAGVYDTDTGAGLLVFDDEIMGIAIIDRPGGFDGERTPAAIPDGLVPSSHGVPSNLFGSLVFEGAILDQLGVEAAIGSVIQVFKENAKEIRTNSLAGFGELEGKGVGRDLGVAWERQSGQQGKGLNNSWKHRGRKIRREATALKDNRMSQRK